MPDGVITGGWSYVIAAYGLTAVVLVAYVASLAARARRAATDRSPGESDDD